LILTALGIPASVASGHIVAYLIEGVLVVCLFACMARFMVFRRRIDRQNAHESTPK